MKLLIAGQARDVEVKFGAGMGEDEFLRFCVQNPELNLERDARGNILIMASVKLHSGRFESRAIIALGKWNDEPELGEVFSSQTGFTLPNGAVLTLRGFPMNGSQRCRKRSTSALPISAPMW